jgi:hypothetical protein
LGDPWHWGRAWTSLQTLSTSYDLRYELPVLDFYFLSEYVKAKNLTSYGLEFLYLDQRNVTLLIAGGTLSRTLYATRNNSQSQPPLVFLMVEHCRNFAYPLFMLINLQTHEVFLITIGKRHEQPVSQESWFRNIWRKVSELVEWNPTRDSDPTILYSDWITVRSHLLTR